MEELLIERLRTTDFLKIDCWCIGLHENHDKVAMNDVGVQNIWIKQYDFANDAEQKLTLYVVELETIPNIANWKHGQNSVLNKLVLKPIYGIGEFLPIADFFSEEAAIEYANKHYPFVDITEKIMKYYNNSLVG